MKQQGGTLFCAWSAYLMCVICASWSDVKTKENRLKLDDIPVQGVKEVTGQNNSHDVDRILQLNESLTLDNSVSPNSILSTEAGQKTPIDDNDIHDLLNVNNSLEHYFSPTTEALPPTSSQTVLLQDVMGVTEHNRSHDDVKAIQLNESVTSDVDMSANSVLSIQLSHENTSINSDLGNERQTVIKSTPLYWNQSTEVLRSVVLPHNRPVGDATLQNKSHDPRETTQILRRGICDISDGMFTSL